MDPTAALEFLARLHASGRREEAIHGGRRVIWHRFGAGRPLVLLHGGHGSWLHWARNIDALSLHRQLWISDMPGYGESDEPVEPTLAGVVASLNGALDQLLGPGADLDLAGFSFGGLVAAHLASGRSGVGRLALLGPAGHGGTRRPTGQLQRWQDAASAGDTKALDAHMRHNLGVHMLHAPAAVDALALRIHSDACARTRFHSKTLSRQDGLLAPLGRINLPLLAIWGEHDVTAVPAEAAKAVTAGHVRRRAHIIPGGGHWVQYECAEAVNRLLLAWLDEDIGNIDDTP